MPQKLIRLTSDTGDGNFNGIFNQEIVIKEDSEIALQSLSVERLSTDMVLTGDNNDIVFASVNATPVTTGKEDIGDLFVGNQAGRIVPFGPVDKSNYKEFLTNIGRAMNRVCDAFQTPAKNAEWGVQHFAAENSAGKIEIGARISPFYQLAVWGPSDSGGTPVPDNLSFVRNDASVVNNIANAEKLRVWEEFQTGAHGMFRNTAAAVPGTPNFNECYAFGVEAVTKSTGVALRTRLKRLLTTTGGLPSFTMGLIKGAAALDKLRDSTIVGSADLDYAIRVNGKDSPIQYIAKKGDAFTDSAATPINFTLASSDEQMNDVLDIRIGSSQVYGVVTSQVLDQSADPVVTTFPNMDGYDSQADYYWCIFMHEPLTKCVLDLVGVTLDPIGPNNQNINTPFRLGNAFDQELTNGRSEIADLPMQSVGDEDGPEPQFTPAVKLDPIVSSFLGFDQSDLLGAKSLGAVMLTPRGEDGDVDDDSEYLQGRGYAFTGQNLFDNAYDADTYLIDTQTFTLDSFDSFGLDNGQRNANSGGSRRNIIATIPVSEQPIPGSTNSLIQYEPSTLNYIQIKNRGDIVTRQIRCRLLTGTYNPVRTEGLSSIVLLIKE